MMTKEQGQLTDRQAEVLRAILAHWAAHGVGPSYGDIVGAMGFASKNAVAAHLRPLIKKGYVIVAGNKNDARGITTVELLAATKLAAANLLTEMEGTK